jgi:hypothetical protein
VEDSSEAFNKKSRKELELKVQGLPPHTRYSAERVLEQLDSVQEQIELFEERMKKVFVTNKELRLLMSLPGVGFILAVVIFSEVGDIDRFPTAAQFASYAGTAPRVHASGGKVTLITKRFVTFPHDIIKKTEDFEGRDIQNTEQPELLQLAGVFSPEIFPVFR